MVTASDKASEETAGAVARAKVLVIDDERGPRESLRILLKTEYDVLCADSVDVGIRMLREHRPDMVIMDIRMPGKTGIEGLRAIRDLDPVVSVVMVTGFGALETAQEAIRLGANDYVKKPFDTFEIRELVGRYVKRTQIERRRNQAADDLGKLNLTLKEELARKEHLATLGQKSAELMHDLRHPLTAVMGYVDLLAAELKDAQSQMGGRWQETSEYLGNLEDSAERCKQLADMWLDISRGKLTRTPIQVREIVDAVVHDCRPLADERKVTLTVEMEDGSAVISVDRMQFTRAFQNLLVNAAEAVPAGTGRVKVWCRCRDGQVELGVDDNGCGMDPEQIKRSVEPFFSTKQGTGTGLGLFIARQAVEAHGGTMRIESETGKGTRITITVPRG
jgi:signal transduction histidine kinase